ncbi:hypothetical protein CBB_A0027 [Clostridium botulinum Bf]|nr:hypothetical protein CBB_A0027 [Clostridium botulinum Bf]
MIGIVIDTINTKNNIINNSIFCFLVFAIAIYDLLVINLIYIIYSDK